MNTYWHKTTRITRRRALAGIGATTASAAFLVACGGGGAKGSSSKQPASSIVTPINDETKNAKKGGVLKRQHAGGYTNLDPTVRGIQVTTSQVLYSQLFYLKAGMEENPNGDFGGDVVESWEFSPDNLNLTLKINPNAHFANIAPVNGRPVDVQDVVYSWQRLKDRGGRRADIVNDVNPAAPVVSVTATDANTVVMKLNGPYAGTIALLASHATGSYYIVPRESADDKVLDLRNKMIGSGPYQSKRYEDGVGFTFERNPGFNQYKRQPYLDQLDYTILPEYAAGLAQFTTGTFLSFAPKQEDILPTKKSYSDMELMLGPVLSSTERVYFGQLPGSPYVDERVRQAYVMTWDRALWLDTVNNISKFKAEGLPVEGYVEGALPSDSWKGWYIDPLGKDFGPNTQFFKQDLTEAKKLVSAAGFANGVSTDISYLSEGLGTWYGPNEILMNMVRDSGLFKVNIVAMPSIQWYDPKNAMMNSRGQVNGAVHVLDFATPDPTNSLFGRYHSQGASFNGGDSTLDSMISKAIREFDSEKRKAILIDVQRYEGGKNYYPRVGGANQLSLAWPALRNRLVYQGGSGPNHPDLDLFIDDSRLPFKKA